MDPLDLFRAQDIFSDPGEHASRYTVFPTDLEALHRALEAFLIHVFRVRRENPGRIRAGTHDVYTRRLSRVLDRVDSLDPRPLNIVRPPEKRAIVDCRHFALMLCSILRQQGIPARPRCGFAVYITKTHWMDHWVCEYWDTKTNRWVMEDPDFGLHNVSSGRFYTGMHAWEIIRKRPDMAQMFGYGPALSQRGPAEVRLNLVRDLAAINGFVSVSGDGWGLGGISDEEPAPEDLSALDEVVRIGDSNSSYAQLKTLYETYPGFCPGKAIHHYDYLITNHVEITYWDE